MMCEGAYSQDTSQSVASLYRLWARSSHRPGDCTDSGLAHSTDRVTVPTLDSLIPPTGCLYRLWACSSHRPGVCTDSGLAHPTDRVTVPTLDSLIPPTG
ncbi:hypothetical protein RRG08_016510 [Elysia crispata]|uniref:Uncharacterized protein n=1 Tax=Elysia crispata TaxID=231223 RepID=A0AAE0Y9F3_9GAST|nr:hypothetical protein RRG08_016510 [Elysia crispata]